MSENLDPNNTPNSSRENKQQGRELSKLAPYAITIGGLLIFGMIAFAVMRSDEMIKGPEADIEIIPVDKPPIHNQAAGLIKTNVPVEENGPLPDKTDAATKAEIVDAIKQAYGPAPAQTPPEIKKNLYWEKFKENQLQAAETKQARLMEALAGNSVISGSGKTEKEEENPAADTTRRHNTPTMPQMASMPSGYDPSSFANSQEALKSQLASIGSIAGGDAGDGGMSQNMQNQKNAFFKDEGKDGNYNDLPFQKVPMKSPYTLFEGDIIDCVLISGANSDLPGSLTAHVSKDIYDSVTGKHKLIPSGTEIVGKYSSAVSYAQNRIAFGWSRMKFANGDTINMGNMAGYDSQGYAGGKDQVDNHYFRLFGQIALVSFFQSIPALINPTESSSTETVENVTTTEEIVTTDADGNPVVVELKSTNPVTTTSSSSSGGTDEFQSDFKESYGTTMAEVGVALAKRNMSIQPTLKLRNGFKFKIIVTRDMVLPPSS